MDIYFACSITGGRQDEPYYQKIVDSLLSNGHEVPTASLANEEVVHFEGIVDADDIYRRDTSWIRECDILVAEVSTPSHGVGFEIGYALNLGKPVICLHQLEIPVSKMITGNPDPNLEIIAYSNIEDATNLLINKLRNFTHT